MNTRKIFYGPIFLVLCCHPDGRACFASPTGSCQLNESNAHRASQARKVTHALHSWERHAHPPQDWGRGVRTGLLGPPCALPLARLPPGFFFCPSFDICFIRTSHPWAKRPGQGIPTAPVPPSLPGTTSMKQAIFQNLRTSTILFTCVPLLTGTMVDT